MSEKLAIYDKEKTVKDLQDVNREVDISIRKFMELINTTERASQGFSRATPREVTAAYRQGSEVMGGFVRVTNELSDSERRLAAVERQLAVAQSEHGQQIANLSNQTRQLTAAQRDRAREEARLAALSESERQRIGNTLQLYNNVQRRLNTLQMEYRNLALAKQLGMNLTDQERVRYEQLQKQIQRYDQALKSVDASMGIHRRNVGNYASGYNGLNMSVAQLAREMPAFTYSVQTGFMALSNNIPIFMDSIRAAIAQNAALRAEGKATVPVWRQLGLAVLGFNTILSIAITLLTVYGKEIGEWIKKLFQADGATGILKRSTEALNKARKEAVKSAASEINTLEKLYRVSTSENASRESRIRAVNKLQALYPSFFKNLSDETIMVGKAKDAYLRLRGAILDSARARAIGNLLEQRQQKKLEDEEKLNKQQNEQVQEALRLRKNINGSTSEFVRDGQGGLIKKDIDNSIIYNRTLQDINVTLGKKRKLNKAYYEENKYLMDEQYKLENKRDVLNYDADKNGKGETIKKPSADKLSAEQRNFLMRLEAAKDQELAINETKFEKGEIDQKEYLENLLSINVDYFNKKINYLKGNNAKEALEVAKSELEKSKIIRETQKKLFDIELEDLKNQSKKKLNEIERSANEISESEYLTDFDRLQKQIDIDDQIISELSDFYSDQINVAKSRNQEIIEIETERDEEIGKIQDERLKKQKSLPDAMVSQIEYEAESLKLEGEITYEQQKQLILKNKRLTTEERNYRLSVLDKQEQININNREIERLNTLKGQLVVKRAINQINVLPPLLSQEDEQKLKEIDSTIEKLTSQNQVINIELKEDVDQRTQGIRNIIAKGFNDLGFSGLADAYTATMERLKNDTASWRDYAVLAASAVLDAMSQLSNKQKERTIANLDAQLEHTRETTEQEIGFINQRLEWLNGLDELSKEQLSERNRLEDEARTYKEQQLQREKLIETQKAKAEQKAASQQALINGALAATMTLAQMGFVAGAIPAALALAFGVAQSIAISSKNPVPQYFVGRQDGPAEWALTQERGRELITDKNDNVVSLGSSGGAKKTWLNKGDKVYTAKQTSEILKNMGSLPKLGQNVYRKASMQNIQPPVIIQNKQDDNSEKIAREVGRQFDRFMKKYDKPRIIKKKGKIIEYKDGNNPVIIGTYDVEKAGENYDSTN